MLTNEALLSRLSGLHRYALRLTRNPEDAKDLVQDTYLAALQYSETYDPAYAVGTWLGSIMKSRFLYLLRSANAAKRNSRTLPLHILKEHLLPSYGPPQENRVAALEAVRRFQEFPKRQRDAALRELGFAPKTRRDPTAARAQMVSRANSKASAVARHIEEARESGCRNLPDIAAWLTARGVKTPRGNSHWSNVQVGRVIKRMSSARPAL